MTIDTATRALSARRTRRVLVLGPDPAAQGGVAAVIGTLLDGWPAEGDAPPPRLLATAVDGGKGLKLAAGLSALARFAVLAATRRVDLAHIHFAAKTSFYRKAVFILLAAALGLPVVGHAHSGLFPGFYRSRGTLGRAYVRFVLNRLDRLVVLSDEWADFYRDLYSRGEPVVVPNPAAIPERLERRPAKTGAVLLSLGRLGKGKGTYDILAAIPAILERHPDTEFHFGGDGEVEEVRRIAAAAPWGDRVRLLGWVSGAEKAAALRDADVFLLPSYAEGLPMALLEAMGHGIPVVTTPVGGIPQAVSDGVNGVLVPPGDVGALTAAILGLLDDPGCAAAMGEAGRRTAIDRYDLGRIRTRLATLYDEVLRRR